MLLANSGQVALVLAYSERLGEVQRGKSSKPMLSVRGKQIVGADVTDVMLQ